MTVNQLSSVLNSCRMFVGYWKDQEFIVSVVGCRCVSLCLCVCICENFSSFITTSRLRHCSHLSLPLLFGINCGFLGVSVSTVAVAGSQSDRRSRYTDTKILRYFCTLPTACGIQLESVADCSHHTHTSHTCTHGNYWISSKWIMCSTISDAPDTRCYLRGI